MTWMLRMILMKKKTKYELWIQPHAEFCYDTTGRHGSCTGSSESSLKWNLSVITVTVDKSALELDDIKLRD